MVSTSRRMVQKAGVDSVLVTRFNVACDRLGLNRTAVHRLTGYARETVSRWANGQMNPPPMLVVQLEAMIPVYEAIEKAKAGA